MRQKKRPGVSRAFPNSGVIQGLLEFLGSLEGDLVGVFAVGFAADRGGETTTRSPGQLGSAVEHGVVRKARRGASGTHSAVVVGDGVAKVTADFTGGLDGL